jgi:hypothetical protein
MRVESAHPQLGMSVRFLRGVAGPVAAGNPASNRAGSGRSGYASDVQGR